ncbi:MAG: c-type cytochrome [Terriglobales bacterium]
MRKDSLLRLLLALATVAAVAGASGCAFHASGTKSSTQLEYQPDMYVQPYLQAFDTDHINPKLPAMRVPPAGTVPVDWVPFPQNSDVTGEDHLANPIPLTPVTLRKGRQIWDTYCIVCHGAEATGLGYIVPHMTQPPPLISGAPLAFSDGRIFTIVSEGLGNMPSYRTELDPAERWTVIHYLRVLQRAANPTPADLARAEQQGMNFSGDLPSAQGPTGMIPGSAAIPHNPPATQQP